MDGRKIYVDASVVLRKILRQPGAIEGWPNWELAVTSELMPLEAHRTLDRVRLSGRLSASELAGHTEDLRLFTEGFQQICIDSGILKRAAAPLPAPLGALDAIHLATALTWMEAHGEDLTLLTHDRQLAGCARLCGVAVYSGSAKL